MCTDLFSSVTSLHAAGLFTNVVELASVLQTLANHNPQLLSQAQLCQLHIYQGDALLDMKEWRRAESEYLAAQQVRKQLVKSRALRSPDASSPEATVPTCEVDVKFKLHQCYVALGQPNQAVNILQSIVAKQRTAKVSMALGKLYQQIGMERPAVAAYREVVREQPLALEAIRALVQLGVKAKEVMEWSAEAGSHVAASRQADWLPSWTSAQAALHGKDYETAVQEMRMLEDGELRNCVGVLVDQGLAHHWAGQGEQAVAVLSRAATLDRQLLRGMDSLAALLANLGRTRELETLATRLMGVSEEAPQPWVAMGHFCHLNKKSPRAVYFAHKACLLDTRNVEALLLKGNVLLDLKKLPDAMNHFREAMQIAGHRFEAHKGMVDCYLGLSRQREAVTVATGACKHLSNSPRALTLYATVLLKEPLSVARAKSLLERAAATGHLPAVYLLVDLLDREGATVRAIELLQRQLEGTSTATLHQLLADLLAKGGQEERAIQHYTQALALDPKNEVRMMNELLGEPTGMAAGPSQRGDSSSERAPSLPHLSPLDQNARMWGQL